MAETPGDAPYALVADARISDATGRLDAAPPLDATPPPDAPVALDASPDAANPAPVSDEALFELDRIRSASKAYYAIHGKFRMGTTYALPGPDGTACTSPGGRLPAVTTWSGEVIWSALGFEIGIPNRFSYHYSSLGTADMVRVTAVGDLDCDATKITYELDLSSTNGAPVGVITQPAPGAD